MPRRLLLLCCLLAYPAVAPAQAPSAAPAAPLQVVLYLTDGSRVVGTPDTDKFKIKAQYAEMDIAFARVASVSFDKSAQVVLKNGDRVSGTPVATEFHVQTQFGRFTIPIALVRTLHPRAPGQSNALPDGLVLNFTFDNIRGDRVIDESDAANDGTIKGATPAKDGKVGGAMSFPGNKAGVLMKNSASLQLQDFTLMAWVKCAVARHASDGMFSAVVIDYGVGGYGLGIDSNSENKVFLAKVGVNAIFSSFEVSDTIYHHLAVTKKGTKVVFYLDGKAYPAGDFDQKFEFKTDLAIAARPDDVAECSFVGDIDEVAIFNRALSDDEVREIYESQK